MQSGIWILAERSSLDFDRDLAIADRIGRLRNDKGLAAVENHPEVLVYLGGPERTRARHVRAHRRGCGQCVLKVQAQPDLVVGEKRRLDVEVQRYGSDARIVGR